MIREGLLKLEGYSCTQCNASLYLFPQVVLPAKFVEYAKSKNEKPDFTYCMEMLLSTGICVVPGSGFGQVEGTFHYRVAFLPQMEDIESFVTRITEFHTKLVAKYK